MATIQHKEITMIPTITGTPQVGKTLAASIGDIQTPVTYQWNRAGTPISGATGSTYVPVAADAGDTLTVTVDSTSAPTSVVTTTSIPVATAIPAISGAPQVGQTLTATNGTWTNSPTSFTYQWNRAGMPIPGATASTYIPAAADVGNTLTISVTATNGSGPSTPAISQATRSVIDIIPANLTLPTISGTARVGQTLTATLGTWSHSPTSFVYKWANSHGLIPGATHLTYVPTSADVGLILEIFVVAINSGGTSAVATSAPTAAVIDIIPTNSAVPTISGTAQVGQTLTATTGTWTHNPTLFTYQWNRAGTAIGGATAATYVPVTGDIGNTLTVSVVATNSGGSSAPSTSAATGAVAAAGGGIPVITAMPVISGTGQNGQILTATNGTWTNSPTSFTYQWKSAGVNATGAGATTANYTADAADVGNTLTVLVIATNGSGSSAPATSAATSPVIDISPVFVNYPIISGTAQVGQTLTTTPGVWTHNPTSYAYQWGNTASGGIAGATASTYVPVTSDIGFMLNVSVVATNSGGSSPAVTSAATGAVLPATPVIPVNTVVPTISGTPQVGQTLTATNGTWTNSPTSFTTIGTARGRRSQGRRPPPTSRCPRMLGLSSPSRSRPRTVPAPAHPLLVRPRVPSSTSSRQIRRFP